MIEGWLVEVLRALGCVSLIRKKEELRPFAGAHPEGHGHALEDLAADTAGRFVFPFVDVGFAEAESFGQGECRHLAGLAEPH